jgi:hypothetical protein
LQFRIKQRPAFAEEREDAIEKIIEITQRRIEQNLAGEPHAFLKIL